MITWEKKSHVVRLIWQHAYPKKFQGWIFIEIALILSVESVSSKLLAIIKMKNIVKIVKLIPQKLTQSQLLERLTSVFKFTYLKEYLTNRRWQGVKI